MRSLTLVLPGALMTPPERPPLHKLPIQEAPLLPARTGVYVFSDTHGLPLYVGKALDLRRRVAQHVREGLGGEAGTPTGTRRKRMLMAATASVAWLPADTELEALLLEESLIKTHRPPYNRRQNKFTRQVYLEVSFDGGAHTLRIADNPETRKSYGPFPDKFYAERLAIILDEQFGVSQRYGGGLRGKAPCAAAAERFLKGFDDGLLQRLQDELQMSATNLQFERAATLRDQLSFCRRFLRRQAFVRAFSSGTLVVTEVRSPSESDHYLFNRGQLVEHSTCGVPERWECEAIPPDDGQQEPPWLLFERALVVYTWLRTGARRKNVRIPGEPETDMHRRRNDLLDGLDDHGRFRSKVRRNADLQDPADIRTLKGRSKPSQGCRE